MTVIPRGNKKTKAMQNLGANKVYYGRNANWELSLSYDVTAAILVFQTIKTASC